MIICIFKSFYAIQSNFIFSSHRLIRSNLFALLRNSAFDKKVSYYEDGKSNGQVIDAILQIQKTECALF